MTSAACATPFRPGPPRGFDAMQCIERIMLADKRLMGRDSIFPDRPARCSLSFREISIHEEYYYGTEIASAVGENTVVSTWFVIIGNLHSIQLY